MYAIQGNKALPWDYNVFPYSRGFTDELVKHSCSLGMRMDEPHDVVFQPRGKSTELFLEHLLSQHRNLQLIMVILPKKGAGSGYGKSI